ncbi:MAG: hypothetical protein NE330_22450 [Lentisphaeraceae bacterium]|nr:hypothetical protein [Lentisphaeraceae bacterium]
MSTLLNNSPLISNSEEIKIIGPKEKVYQGSELYEALNHIELIYNEEDSNGEKIAKLVAIAIKDGLYFEGIEQAFLHFLKIWNKNKFKDDGFFGIIGSQKSIIIDGYIRLPISDEFHQHLLKFSSKKRYLNSVQVELRDVLDHIKINGVKNLKKLAKSIRDKSLYTEQSYFLSTLRPKMFSTAKQVDETIEEQNLNSADETIVDEMFDAEGLDILEELKTLFTSSNFLNCLNFIFARIELIDQAFCSDELDPDVKASIDLIACYSTYREFYDQIIQNSQYVSAWISILPQPQKEKKKYDYSNKLYVNEHLTIEQVKCLLDTEDDQLFFYFAMLIYTGMRPGMPFSLKNLTYIKFEGIWSLLFKTTKTDQKLIRNLSLLMPDKVLKRVKKIWQESNGNPLKNLKFSKCYKYFRDKIESGKLYLCRKTFVNHLTIRICQYNGNQFFTKFQTIFTHMDNVDELINSSHNPKIRKLALQQVLRVVGEIIGHSPNSMVLIKHYISADFILFINKKMEQEDENNEW